MAFPNEYLDSLFNLKRKGPSVQNRATCVLVLLWDKLRALYN